MPAYKRLQLLSVNCDTVERGQKKEMSMSNHSKAQTKTQKLICLKKTKSNQEMNHFIVGPDKEVDMAANPK